MDITGARKAAGLAAGILLAAVGATGCTALQGGQGQPTQAGVSTVTVTAPVSTTAGPGASASAKSESGSPEGGAGKAAESAATTSRKPATTTTTTTKSHVRAGPKVESLTVLSKPSCPVVGTPEAPFSSPGHGVIIAWKVSDAEGAAISVDNPGMYAAYGDDYPATGQLELAFPCEAGNGETTHTYTVWPKGAKGISKTLTISARNNS
ncbi:hypothetical protein ACTG9Q_27325 [Actinokineospora sp. 24-640]